MSPWHLPIIYEVMPLHIYNRYTSNIPFWKHLWRTASAIATGIFLTEDWNKNIAGASITANNWEIISKNIP